MHVCIIIVMLHYLDKAVCKFLLKTVSKHASILFANYSILCFN